MLVPSDRSVLNEQRREMLEEEDRYFEELAQNATVHLERAMKARLRRPRNHDALADYHYAMARVEEIMREFAADARPIPDYLMQGWEREIQGIREAA